MTRCHICGDATHLDFPSGLTRCNGCERTPAYCRCARVQSAPAWVQRAREGRGLAKDMSGRNVA
jgi:hypothetical protein